MWRPLLCLLILSGGFVFAQGGLIAFVSKVGELEHDLVVVTPQGEKQSRLSVQNAEHDLRVLAHAGYFIVLQDFWDDTLFIFDARSGSLEPVTLPPEFSGSLDLTAGTARYSLFKQGGNYFLLDLQRATLHALAVEGQDYSYSAAFSPDGQFVLVASVAGLWQLPTRDPTEKTLIDTTAVTTAQFIDETSFVYISEGNVLKRASTQGVNLEDLAQDVVTFYPTDDTVFFSTSAGGLYGLELASLTSRLVHPFSAPVQVVWADADQALVTIEEDGIWFYVTLATGELLSLDALDGALPVAGLRPESDAVLFSDSLDVGDPRTFWGLDLTTGQVAEVGDFPNGWTGQPEGSQLLVAVFDHAERSTDLYRLDAHGGGTPLFKALNVWGAFSPDGRFVAVDARTGNPDYRASEGLTLLLNADGTLVRELGRGGYGVLWLSEPE